MNIMNIGVTGEHPSYLPIHDVQVQPPHKRSQSQAEQAKPVKQERPPSKNKRDEDSAPTFGGNKAKAAKPSTDVAKPKKPAFVPQPFTYAGANPK